MHMSQKIPNISSCNFAHFLRYIREHYCTFHQILSCLLAGLHHCVQPCQSISQSIRYREVRWSPVQEIVRKRIWWTGEFWVADGSRIVIQLPSATQNSPVLLKSRCLADRSRSASSEPARTAAATVAATGAHCTGACGALGIAWSSAVDVLRSCCVCFGQHRSVKYSPPQAHVVCL